MQKNINELEDEIYRTNNENEKNILNTLKEEYKKKFKRS